MRKHFLHITFGFILLSMIIMVVSIINAQPFKNLKVIRDPLQVNNIMDEFTKSLGVKCEFCHVKENYADDSKKELQVARYMMRMTEMVNRQFYQGKNVVTCISCHRGSPKVPS